MKQSNKITAMRAGGAALGAVRDKLAAFVSPGLTFADIEAEAQRLIAQTGMKPSFSTVAGYHWATCIMKNDQMCHGIPSRERIVNSGDILTVDVGLINQGFHLDTTITFGVGEIDSSKQHFLAVGRKALAKAIDKIHPGVSVYEVSKAMQTTVEKAGYGAVYQLTGHGVGEQLHMAPSIPCVAYRSDKRILLKPGQTLAVEIMYTEGKPDLTLDSDGWTYRTVDRSLAAMFEDTVLVTETGVEVLTKPPTSGII